MTLALTAATGQLGRLVVADLLQRGVPADQIVAVVRDADKAADLGVTVHQADYNDRAALTEAFAGVDRLLFVSGSEVGQRIDQHRNVIEAAKAASVGQVIYTSAPHATDTTLILAPEHAATEGLLAESGLPVTLLRNNWYHENYLPTLATARERGVVVSSAGAGRVASAARADYAAAAAAVLTGEGHAGKVYELSGDVAWDFSELTTIIARVLGREVTFHPVTADELDGQLSAAGLDEATRGFVIGLDRNTADGELAEVNGQLSALIGRPTTPVEDTLRQAAAGS